MPPPGRVQLARAQSLKARAGGDENILRELKYVQGHFKALGVKADLVPTRSKEQRRAREEAQAEEGAGAGAGPAGGFSSEADINSMLLAAMNSSSDAGEERGGGRNDDEEGQQRDKYSSAPH